MSRPDTLVHAWNGNGRPTLCCGKTSAELPIGALGTYLPNLVTCPGRPAAPAAEAGEMTEAGELRVRLQHVEHDLQHVARERDQAAAEAARLRAVVEVQTSTVHRLRAELRQARGDMP